MPDCLCCLHFVKLLKETATQAGIVIHSQQSDSYGMSTVINKFHLVQKFPLVNIQKAVYIDLKEEETIVTCNCNLFIMVCNVLIAYEFEVPR